MSVDYYSSAAQRWANGAVLVYGPIGRELVAMSPHSLTGRRVLDVGAGTGVVSTALAEQQACPVAADLSSDMLAWDAPRRPPAVVADVLSLPFVDDAVHDSIAAFVLNHLADPAAAFAELVRVTRPGGAVLATVYSNASRSQARDAVDEAARQAGWEVPEWYVDIKAKVTPILGTAESMARAATKAGLWNVVVEERAVDVGVTEAEQLVEYRYGQAHFGTWLDAIGPDKAAEVRRRAADAARPIMQPYRPIVVFLSAVVPVP